MLSAERPEDMVWLTDLVLPRHGRKRAFEILEAVCEKSSRLFEEVTRLGVGNGYRVVLLNP